MHSFLWKKNNFTDVAFVVYFPKCLSTWNRLNIKMSLYLTYLNSVMHTKITISFIFCMTLVPHFRTPPSKIHDIQHQSPCLWKKVNQFITPILPKSFITKTNYIYFKNTIFVSCRSYKSKGIHILIKLNVVLGITFTQGVKKSTIENENQMLSYQEICLSTMFLFCSYKKAGQKLPV